MRVRTQELQDLLLLLCEFDQDFDAIEPDQMNREEATLSPQNKNAYINPAAVQRDFRRIISQIGTPARPSKP